MKYIVTVLVHAIERYEVEAENADKAMDLWQEGRFLGSDDARMESEPLKARKKGVRP